MDTIVYKQNNNFTKLDNKTTYNISDNFTHLQKKSTQLYNTSQNVTTYFYTTLHNLTTYIFSNIDPFTVVQTFFITNCTQLYKTAAQLHTTQKNTTLQTSTKLNNTSHNLTQLCAQLYTTLTTRSFTNNFFFRKNKVHNTFTTTFTKLYTEYLQNVHNCTRQYKSLHNFFL